MAMYDEDGNALKKSELLALATEDDPAETTYTFDENVYEAAGFQNDRYFGSTRVLKYAKGQSVPESEIDALYGSDATAASISPATGPAVGGTSFEITGTNLGGVDSVTFGGAAATGLQVSADQTKLTGKTPAHAAGAVNVVLSGEDAADLTKNNFYTYS